MSSISISPELAGPFFHGLSETDAPIETTSQRSDLEELRALVDKGLSVDDILLEDTSGKAARYVGWLDRLVMARKRAQFAKANERRVHAYYLYGKSGVGKTTFVMNHYGLGDVYRVQSYRHPWDEYEGQPVICLDDFAGELPFNVFLGVTDRWNLALDARYHQRLSMWTTVWVLSNLPLTQMYTEEEKPRRESMFRRFDAVLRLDRRGTVTAFDPTELTDYLGDPYTADPKRFPSRKAHRIDSDWARCLGIPDETDTPLKPVTADDIFP